MENTRCIRIIKSFNPDKFKQFGKFVNSPFFNSNKNLIQLYYYLKKRFPSYPEGYLDEKRVHKKIYTGKYFSQKRIREMSHEMLKLCEKFLSYTGFQKDTFNENLFLLREINHRNLPDIYQHYYNLTEELLKNGPIGYDSYNNRNSLYKELFRFYNTFDINKAKDKMQPVIENTGKSCTFELLRCFIGAQAANVIFNVNYDLKLKREITGFLKTSSYIKEPVLELYYHLLKISSGENEQSYKTVKKLLEKYDNLFNNEIKREINSTLHNYLYHYKYGFSNRGNKEKKSLIYNMIKSGLFKDSNDFVLPNLFFNYIDILIDSRDYDEAEKFLNDNKEKLISSNKDDYINFLYGELFKAQGKYKEAVDFLNRLSTRDKELYSLSKIYELICYYELGYEKNLEKSAVSVQNFINRNKSMMRPEEFEQDKLFLKYFTGLITLKQSGKPFRRYQRRYRLRNSNPPAGRLKNEVTKEKGFFNKQWLLSKIESFQNVSP